jgi:hypothetical protein
MRKTMELTKAKVCVTPLCLAVLQLVLGFLALGFAAGFGFTLGGRPFPGTLRMASRAEAGYTGECVIGLIPAIISRCRTVVSFIPSFSAISATVKPSIFNISENLTEKLSFFKNFAKNY